MILNMTMIIVVMMMKLMLMLMLMMMMMNDVHFDIPLLANFKKNATLPRFRRGATSGLHQTILSMQKSTLIRQDTTVLEGFQVDLKSIEEPLWLLLVVGLMFFFLTSIKWNRS